MHLPTSLPVSSLESRVLRIETRDRKILGTGALVSENQVLTCAHVINGESPGQTSSEEQAQETIFNVSFLDLKKQPIQFHLSDSSIDTKLDLAIITLPEAISGRPPLDFDEPTPNSQFFAVGFQPAGIQEWYLDRDWQQLRGTILSFGHLGHVELELTNQAVLVGSSGSPLWVESQKAAVGIIVSTIENSLNAQLIPTRQILELFKNLRLKASAVQCRDPSSYSVQLLRGDDGQIVGTAIVSNNRLLTSAQAFTAAGTNPKVHFPNERNGNEKVLREVQLERVIEAEGADLAILQLQNGSWPWPPEQSVPVGAALTPGEFIAMGFHGKLAIPRDFEGKIKKHLDDAPSLLRLYSENSKGGISGAGVLDRLRNLIVGIVTRAVDTEGDDDLILATDTKILQGSSIDLGPAAPLVSPRAPQVQHEPIQEILPSLPPLYRGAPPVLQEIVGREYLLSELNCDWNDPAVRITALTGSKGIGKTALVRYWIEKLDSLPAREKPDGIVWWSFRGPSDIESFFERVLIHFGCKKAQGSPTDTLGNAELLGSILSQHRFLLVLDCLDTLHSPSQPLEGGAANPALSRLFELVARPRHGSHTLVLSRELSTNLMRFASCRNRTVSALDALYGTSFLQTLGTQASAADLLELVHICEGNPRLLKLLATYLGHGRLPEAPVDWARRLSRKSASEKFDAFTAAVDSLLSRDQRTILMLLATIRAAESPENIRILLHQLVKAGHLGKDAVKRLGKLTTLRLAALIAEPISYELILEDPEGLRLNEDVRDFYSVSLATKPTLESAIQGTLARHFRNLSHGKHWVAALEFFRPAIEAIHHETRRAVLLRHDDKRRLCFEKAFEWYSGNILHAPEFPLTSGIGAWATNLEILSGFFTEDKIELDAVFMNPRLKHTLYQELSVTLLELGQLELADLAITQSMRLGSMRQDSASLAFDLRRRSKLFCLKGPISAAVAAAVEADDLASKNNWDANGRVAALVSLGWALHLGGCSDASQKKFELAEQLFQESQKNVFNSPYLIKGQGIRHASHLIRQGKYREAREIVENNHKLGIAERWHLVESACERLLGDLESVGESQGPAQAIRHYNRAVDLGRNSTSRLGLVEALIARGRWYAYLSDPAAAREDLSEALNLSTLAGLRLAEVDIRVARAQADFRAGRLAEATQGATFACELATSLGYHWGQVDAATVKSAVNAGG